MKKVMITGATGFIGRNLLDCLDRDIYEIHCVTRKNGMPGITGHRADLLHPSEIAGVLREVKPDLLIHLAWNVEDQSYWYSLENNEWAESSLFLVKEFLKYGSYVIFAGTSASYDYTKEILIEDAKMEYPDSLYGMAKWYTSWTIKKMVESVGALYLEARIFSIFGEYEHNGRLMPNIIQSLLKGETVKNCKWPLERDYIYVKDAVRAIAHLIRNEAEGIYNISSGQAVSIKRIVECIADQLEKRRLLFLEDPCIDGEVPCIIGSNQKLLDAGFHYMYSFEEAIAKTIQWHIKSM